MPRVSRAQAEAHREVITEQAARLFRERGIRTVSVADVMAAAGLTHGGFYGHFESKDALAGIAGERAFGQAIERWKKRAAAEATPAAQRAAIIEGYLRPQSVRDAANGCPTAALCVDVSREADDAPVRAAYVAGVEEMVDILGATERAGDAAADRRAALDPFADRRNLRMSSRPTRNGVQGAPVAHTMSA